MMIDPKSVPNFGEYTIKRGRNIPLESAPMIENVLLGPDDDIVWAIYNSEEIKDFIAENGLQMLDFGGGEFGMSVTVLTEIPQSILRNAKMQSGKAIGLRTAKRVLEECAAALEDEPYY